MTESPLLSSRSMVPQSPFGNQQGEPFPWPMRLPVNRPRNVISRQTRLTQEGRELEPQSFRRDLTNAFVRELLFHDFIIIDLPPFQESEVPKDRITLSDSVSEIILQAAWGLPSSLRKRIEELSKLPADWDGEGALPVRRDILAKATHFIKYIQTEAQRFIEPFVAPTFDGFVQVEWCSEHRSLEVEFSPDGLSVVGGEDSGADKEYHSAESTLQEVTFVARCYNWVIGNERIWPGPSR